MRDFNLATLALAALACAAGASALPLLWTVVNLALLATVAGMLLVRQKFSGLDLARTLKITLAALAANALVAIAAFGLGFGLRAGVLALAG